MLEGGHEFDGRPLVPFDARGMRAAARRIRDAGIRSVAIAAVFSPLNASCEEEAAAIVREECPDVAVTLSHRLGRIGLLERENAALLNACLIELARKTTRAFTRGPARERHRGAALPHPERRHRHAGRGGGGVPGLQLRVGADQLDARRRVPVQARRGAGGGRGRHHHRHRQPAPRLPARGQQRGRDRRGPHALPHARSALAGPGRRHAGGGRAGRSPSGRPAWAIASPSRRSSSAATSSPSPTSRSPPGSSTSATARAWPSLPGRAGGGRPRPHPRHDRGRRGPHEDRRGRCAADRGGRRVVPGAAAPGRRLRGPQRARTRRWPTRWAPRSPR